jgi:hypothetical protein
VTGNPLAGVQVCVDWADGEEHPVTVTNEKGEYEFKKVGPKAKLQAFLIGYELYKEEIELKEGQENVVNIALFPNFIRLSGKVVDRETGEPLTQVFNTVIGIYDYRGDDVVRATTDERGEYTISQLKAGKKIITVRADGYEDIWKEALLVEDTEMFFELAPLSGTVVLPTENTVVTSEGVEIQVPAGAVEEETEIVCEKLDGNGEVLEEALVIYELEAFEKETRKKIDEFNQALTIIFSYNDVGVDEDCLGVQSSANLENWAEVEIVACDKEANKITIRTNHFSYYAIVEKTGLQTVDKIISLGSEEIEASYPNPVNPECWIPLSGMNKAKRAKVKIYNILGQLVREIECSKFRGTRIYWDGRDSCGLEVPSGVYFYEVAGEGLRKMVVLR